MLRILPSESYVVGSDMENLAGRCESLFYELEEAAYDIYQLAEHQDNQPGKLEKAENRLALIHRIKNKYGESIPDILKSQKVLEAEYSDLCSVDDRLQTSERSEISFFKADSQTFTRVRKILYRIKHDGNCFCTDG